MAGENAQVPKPAAREQGRAVRAGMTAAQQAEAGRQIVARCQAELDWASYRRVSLFLPIADRGEVDTRPLLGWVGETWPHTWVRVEPAVAVFRPDGTQFDLVIVPLLAFDDAGGRVGYGSGYYDRFLASQRAVWAVGLAYEDALVAGRIATKAHDVPLDMVITERRVHRFAAGR